MTRLRSFSATRLAAEADCGSDGAALCSRYTLWWIFFGVHHKGHRGHGDSFPFACESVLRSGMPWSLPKAWALESAQKAKKKSDSMPANWAWHEWAAGIRSFAN